MFRSVVRTLLVGQSAITLEAHLAVDHGSSCCRQSPVIFTSALTLTGFLEALSKKSNALFLSIDEESKWPKTSNSKKGG
jgi:hypothetical protein